MNIRILLILLLTVLWFGLSSWWYTCKIKTVCADSPPTELAASQEAEDTRPVVFNWDEDKAITRASFPKYKAGVVGGKGGDNILEITGRYFADEANNTTYDNLGLARASAARALLVDEIPAERMRLKGELVEREEVDELKSNPFEALAFNWTRREMPKEEGVAAADAEEAKEPETEIIEMDDRIIIYFPYNSAQGKIDQTVANYLDKLAERIKETNESVSIIGHTDDKGATDYNQKLGMQRAQSIQARLVKQGVTKGSIDVNSMGETKPVATNDTEQGRQLNRRTVVQLSKAN